MRQISISLAEQLKKIRDCVPYVRNGTTTNLNPLLQRTTIFIVLIVEWCEGLRFLSTLLFYSDHEQYKIKTFKEQTFPIVTCCTQIMKG